MGRKKMNYQHVENLLIRVRGKSVEIKTTSGALYDGVIADVTNDYVTLKIQRKDEETEQVTILLHSVESISQRDSR
jgi:PDZ domain-containing secreted protein